MMLLYIVIAFVFSGSSIRQFRRVGGDVVYATIKSTSMETESSGYGRHRHTEIKTIVDVEFTYQGQTYTKSVYKPVTKKVGDKIKLGITDNGRIYVLHLQFDLTFVIFTIVFAVVLIVLWMQKANKKERSQNGPVPFMDEQDYGGNAYTVSFDNHVRNDDDLMWRQEEDKKEMKRSMLQSDMQTAAMIAQHTAAGQSGNVKKDVDEVPKLKFELKKPLEKGETREQEEWRP
ncbi:MAG: hypothetical protein ACI4EK_07580 [Wujia sp.]